MAAMARDFTACFGRIDVLVNNAGITVLRSFLDVDEKMRLEYLMKELR